MKNKITIIISIILVFCLVFTSLFTTTRNTNLLLDKKNQTIVNYLDSIINILNNAKNTITGIVQNGKVTIIGITEDSEELYKEKYQRLKYGKYTYNAKEIEGFEVVGESSKKVTLDKKNKNLQITFIYRNIIEEPEVPEVPVIPEVPEEPEIPEVPEVPEEPEIPEVPEVPEEPEVPEVPEEPEVPEVPEEPEVPVIPEVPEEPEVPEVPVIPEVPEEPEVPEVPEEPEVPVIPEVPEEPEVPEVPVIPEVPEEPEVPVIPEVPENLNMNEVPYISRYHTKPEVKIGEEVIIDFYITDYSHKEYLQDDFSERFSVIVKIEGKEDIVLKNLKAGDHSVGLGSFNNEGEIKFSMLCIDQYGRHSHELFHYFKVVGEEVVNKYIMTEADLIKYNIKNNDNYGEIRLVNVDLTNQSMEVALANIANETVVPSKSYIAFIGDSNGDGIKDSSWKQTVIKYANDYDSEAVFSESKATREGLQNLLNDIKSQGYNYMEMLPGVYRIDHELPISVPNEFTLDMNGATIKLNQSNCDSAIMLEISNVTDSHVINGNFVGDYYEHDYTNAEGSSEWVHGISITNAAQYCSFENVNVLDIAGYGIINGIGTTQGKYDYINHHVGGLQFKLGDIDKNNGNQIESSTRSVSDYIDLKKAEGHDYLQVSRYLGYQGVSGGTWNIICHFYDSNKNHIKSIDSYQFRRVEIPEGAKFMRVTLLNGVCPTDLTVYSLKIPTNCTIKNVKVDNARCVGIAPAAMNNLLFEDIDITRSGQSHAKCALDAEDGWDLMQDVTFRRLNFYNNPNNDFLTCAGQNFVIENIKTNKFHAYPRTNGFVIRNCEIGNFSTEHGGVKSGYQRVENNTITSNVSYPGGLIKNHSLNKVSAASVIKNCDLQAIPTGDSHVIDCTFTLDSFSTYLGSSLVIDNCTFQPKEGVENYRLSFNKFNINRVFNNCKFLGNATLSNHNNFNSAVFNNCEFENTNLEPGVSSEMGNIEFNNCKINCNSNRFIKLSPFAYSSGLTNVNFNNCEITHNVDSPLIYFYSKPTGGQISFKNCTINKDSNCILDGYGNPPFESKIYIDLIFDNTEVNIPIIAERFVSPENFNVIIK